jgi:hypothetical protein
MTSEPDDDLQALRRMLPVPAERDFPPGRRHQHEEHLMTSWLHLSRRPATPRRRLVVRLATSAAVAAAAFGAVVALHPSSTTTAGRPGLPQAPGSRAVASAPVRSGPLTHISTASYVLDRTPRGVQITLRARASRTAMAAQLQKDLAAMGVQARVSRDRPKATIGLVTVASRNSHGDFVATVHPDLIAKYPELVIFSAVKDGDSLTITLRSR